MNKRENGLVSIIMPAYRAGGTIGESVESVLAQTYSDWELIVVAEDEESAEAVEKYGEYTKASQDHIRILRSKTRLGIAKSRNLGIAESRGEWLAFLDSDDRWVKTKLEKQITLGENISFTASAFIDSESKPYGYVMHVPQRLSYNELLKRNMMSCSSVIIKRELALKHGFGPDNTREDYLFWLDAVKETGYAVGLDEPLLEYRITNTSKSAKRFTAAVGTYNTYRAVGCSAISSAWRTIDYWRYSREKRRLIYGSRSPDY